VPASRYPPGGGGAVAEISFPVVIGGDVWWQERMPTEDAWVTIVRRGSGGRVAADRVRGARGF